MLSFHRGQKIGRIDGGKLNGEYLYVNQDDGGEPDILTDLAYKLISQDFWDKHKKLSYEESNIIKNCIKDNINPEERRMRELVEEARKDIKNTLKKTVSIGGGKIQPLPDMSNIERIFVSGPSGSGKSTYISRYLVEVRKQDPEAEIFVVSRVKNDPAFKHIKDITYVEITNDLIYDPLRPEEFANPNGHQVYMIVDDIDTINDKKTRESVRSFLHDLLECGRHMKINVLYTNHHLTNASKTKTLLNEATRIVVFPKSGATYQIRRLLKEYVGLGSKKSNDLMTLNSRWLSISRLYPIYVIHEKGIIIT